jgi:glutamyl-tRNA synthetase
MAPSPTGYAHLGSARTALFDYLFARQSAGCFVLRLEDTDQDRGRAEYESAIYDELRWLGLNWDEGPDVGGPHGPYRQSERLDLYREHAARLIENGAAYRCYCTPEELEAERREAHAQGLASYRYSRRCLTDPPPGRRSFTVRFLVPPGETTFVDLVRGELRFDNSTFGDPVIVKSNGWPLYNFANPIDDALMLITHVFRGEEHVPNTPLQIMFAAALGLPAPEAFAHFPVIVGQDGRKLSKRLHPETRLGLYRERGYLPEAVVNYLALLGWNPGTEQEVFSLDELVRAFDIDRVQRSNAMFDWGKLDWLNGQHMRMLSDQELAARLEPFLPDLPASTIQAAAPALKERLPRLDKAQELLRYLGEAPAAPELTDEQREMVGAAIGALEAVDWETGPIEAALETAREAGGWSRGKFLTVIRSAVAGRVSPPIGATLALLDRREAMARLRRVLA